MLERELLPRQEEDSATRYGQELRDKKSVIEIGIRVLLQAAGGCFRST